SPRDELADEMTLVVAEAGKAVDHQQLVPLASHAIDAAGGQPRDVKTIGATRRVELLLVLRKDAGDFTVARRSLFVPGPGGELRASNSPRPRLADHLLHRVYQPRAAANLGHYLQRTSLLQFANRLLEQPPRRGARDDRRGI